MEVVFDESRWPLLIVRFEGSATDEQFDRYLKRYGELISSGPLAAVMEASHSGIPSIPQQRRKAAWMMRYSQAMRENSRGVAFVIAHPGIRFALSTMLVLAPLPCPRVVLPTEREAVDWCVQRLQDAGLTVPFGQRAG